MKKTTIFVFLLALALIMLAAIPATAGPALHSPAILETPIMLEAPSSSAATFQLPAAPIAENAPLVTLSIETPAPFMAPASLYAMMINRPTIYIAILAALAALMGLWRPNTITSYHRMQKASDRLHGLARDQDCVA